MIYIYIGLLWHVTSPEYLKLKKNKNDLRESIRRYIYTTVSHFNNRIYSWDVVNEILSPNGNIANSFIYKILNYNKDDMIQLIYDCFKWSKLADPNCFLYYNDNKVEGFYNNNDDDYLINEHSKKSNSMYDLLNELIKIKTPIDGCGLQAHFNASGCNLNRIPSPNSILNNLNRLSKLKLKINISEMDVRISKLINKTDDEKLLIQDHIYRNIIKTCYSHDSFEGCTFW